MYVRTYVAGSVTILIVAWPCKHWLAVYKTILYATVKGMVAEAYYIHVLLSLLHI